jgi:hypothetical protein
MSTNPIHPDHNEKLAPSHLADSETGAGPPAPNGGPLPESGGELAAHPSSDHEKRRLIARFLLGGASGEPFLRVPPELERAREAFILERGSRLYRLLPARGVTFFRQPPLPSPREAELEIRGREIALAQAWIQMLVERGEYDLKTLRREYFKIVSDPISVLTQINKKVRDRHNYNLKRAAAITRKEQKWNDDLRTALLKMSPSSRDPYELLDSKLETKETNEWLSEFLSTLTPAERTGFEELLNNEWPGDSARRQRQSRARKKFRSWLVTKSRFLTLL